MESTSKKAVGAGIPAPTRRGFLSAGLGAGIGAMVGGAGGFGLGAASASETSPSSTPSPSASTGAAENAAGHGSRTVPFYGAHQAAITAVPGAFASFVALDLLPQTTRERQRAWMKLITDDIARLSEGRAALADVEPELAATPAGLTVTVGFGEGFVDRAAGLKPTWLKPLPAFSIDALEERFSGGDVLFIVQADEPVTVAHALRLLLRDSRSFATLRWRQDGFRRARGTDAPGSTMRNLFGQVDGTANFAPGTTDFDDAVWAREHEPAWLHGGTSFVLRRIAMDMDKWDEVDRVGRENAIGRTLADGAPLTGGDEHTPIDFDAVGPNGLPVIAAAAHTRRAHVTDPKLAIARLGYNYEERPSDPSVLSDTGLLFGSWQADVDAQFVPMQSALAQADLMNLWTTPIGSAVFAIPPGCFEGEYLGQALLE